MRLRLSVVAWAVLVCALMVWRLHGMTPPLLGDDSYQYLSVAKNAAKGLFGYTSIVHFEAERTFGTMPAPQVTFPAGYSVAIAAASQLGLSLTHAALLLNVAATVACLALLSTAASALGVRRWVAQGMLGFFVLNWLITLFAIGVMAEALFSMLVLASVVVLVTPPVAKHQGSASWGRAVAAGVLLGLAYYVRYAAIFVLVGFIAAGVVAAVAGWREQRRQLLIASLVASMFVASGMLRNVMLIGNWRGGNEKSVHHPFVGTLHDTINIIDELLLGVRASSSMTLVHLVFYALVAWVVCIAIKNARATPDTPDAPKTPAAADASRLVRRAAVQLGVIAVVYCLCMFYAGLTTVISYGTRMFVPILGTALLALACATDVLVSGSNEAGRARLRAIGIATLAIYAGANLWSSTLPVWNDRTSWGSKALLERNAKGKSAADAVREASTRGQTVVANDGQLVGHVLAVPTVSLVGTDYSSKKWDEKLLHDVTRQFKAGTVVITRPVPADDIYPSAFVLALANATHPAWLVPVFESPDVIVYRVEN